MPEKVYLWMPIVGGFVCALMAWGIGANDVANSFSTSVGSRAITLKQAVLIAAIFEFTGAFFLSGGVTNTVRKGIADQNDFLNDQYIFMAGMFAALLSSALWLVLATKNSLPVSTTQSIVGGIIGFVVTYKGWGYVSWSTVIKIVIFWIVTPLVAGTLSFTFFSLLKRYVLNHSNSYQRALKTWPIYAFIVSFVMVFFAVAKGLGSMKFKNIYIGKNSYDFNIGYKILVSIGISAFVALVAWLALVKTGVVERYVDKKIKTANKALKKSLLEAETKNERELDNVLDNVAASLHDSSIDDDEPEPELTQGNVININGTPETKNGEALTEDEFLPDIGDEFERIRRATVGAFNGINQDIHEGLTKNEENLNKKCVKFDERTEALFAWFQVCAGALDILAHGSNDVANAVAPFAAVLQIYKDGLKECTGDGDDNCKSKVPQWVLALTASFMSIGLATYGYKILKVLGCRVSVMTCSRGYCIILASAITVIVGSYLGLPASTTHAQVGAVVGCGLTELFSDKSKLTWKTAVNWKLLIQIFIGWIGTIVISASTCSLIFCLMIYSPPTTSNCDASWPCQFIGNITDPSSDLDCARIYSF